MVIKILGAAAAAALLLRLRLLGILLLVLLIWRMWPLEVSILLSPYSRSRRRHVFIVLLFEMLGRLCKSDGAVSEAEIRRTREYMRRELRLGAAEENTAIDAFRRGKVSAFGMEYLVSRFYQVFRRETAVLNGALQIMEDLARADGALSAEEQRWIRFARELFGFTGATARTWGGGRFREEEREEERSGGASEQGFPSRVSRPAAATVRRTGQAPHAGTARGRRLPPPRRRRCR